MLRTIRFAAALVLGLTLRAAAQTPEVTCLESSGDAGARCLERYLAAVEPCRVRSDAACEDRAVAEGGAVDTELAATESPIRRGCTDPIAEKLGYLGPDDVVKRIPEACSDFGADLLDLAFADDPGSLALGAKRCQLTVARSLRRLRTRIVRAYGTGCIVPENAGDGCNRGRRDARVAQARARAHAEIERCGAVFDTLALSEPASGATVGERIDDLIERVVVHSRHFAQLVYPPNDFGPTADFGPFPVGIKTLDLVDPSRRSTDGMGPRPVTTEVYYPSRPEAVDGHPRDIARVLGLDIVATPAYRDVALAPGAHPLVLFSHGNNGIRIQSFFFAAHLASYGFVVASPDHHGNTFVDTLAGILDPQVATNRPLDMSFLIDQFLAFNSESGNFFAGAVDPERIGASGHSFGGLTMLLLAGPGEFNEPRIKAVFPQAPASPFSDEYFAGITVPILIVGGSIDETTPFEANQEKPFEKLPSGAAIVGLGEIIDAGHFTFSDFCEVPRNLLSFLGGFDEACEPRHLPWRHAHDIVNYLGLNFFDATLNGNEEARQRLSVESVAPIEDLVFRSK